MAKPLCLSAFWSSIRCRQEQLCLHSSLTTHTALPSVVRSFLCDVGPTLRSGQPSPELLRIQTCPPCTSTFQLVSETRRNTSINGWYPKVPWRFCTDLEKQILVHNNIVLLNQIAELLFKNLWRRLAVRKVAIPTPATNLSVTPCLSESKLKSLSTSFFPFWKQTRANLSLS